MAYKITENCAACGTCIDECPNGAISAGDIYKIDPTQKGLFVRCYPLGRMPQEEELMHRAKHRPTRAKKAHCCPSEISQFLFRTAKKVRPA